MPTYNFRNKETGEETAEFLSISEYAQFQIDNPDLESMVTAPAIISGLSSLKPDKGFRSLLSEIKRKNPKGKINDFGGPGKE